jgi:DNA repair protein RadC
MITEIKIMTVRDAVVEPREGTPGSIAEFWRSEVARSAWYQEDKEMVVVFCLNARNMITAYNLVSIGLMDACLIHPREVFRPAILAGAAGVVVAHNHPSGDTTPSAEDIRITRRLIEAGRIIGIKLADHVIIGSTTNYSIKETGTIDFAQQITTTKEGRAGQ